MLSKRAAGGLGEEEAVKYLKKNGYRIIERNFSSRYGEIDIIASEGEYTVFVEVKLRENVDHGTPGEFVTPSKRDKLRKTALVYAQKKRLDTFMRFDVVEIVGKTKDNKLCVERIGVIKNAF